MSDPHPLDVPQVTSPTIVSGGQTGVDRAALDVALERGMPCGGWCPAGRWAEDGPIDPRYPLRETPSADPAERTEWNVRDSDATLVLVTSAGSPGTDRTLDAARRLGRPVYLWHLDARPEPHAFRRWLQVHNIRVLNVAGPRESESPGVYARACGYLRGKCESAKVRKCESAKVRKCESEERPARGAGGEAILRVLITGGGGLLGAELIRQTPAEIDIHSTRRTSPVEGAEAHAVELSDAAAVEALWMRLRPELVIHTAYSQAAGERDVWRATENVVRACRAAGAALVCMSTDAVLDGESSPYGESAEPAPVHEYGRWKARAERHVRSEMPDAAVVRTSLIVRAEPPDRGSARVLDGLRRGEPVRLFTDELRCPIAVEDLAAQLWEIALLPVERRGGVWHLAGPEALSRYALGVLLALRHGLDPSAIIPTPSAASPAPRPRDLRLLTPRADRELRTRARPISAVLFPNAQAHASVHARCATTNGGLSRGA